jgi:hypothetical protein
MRRVDDGSLAAARPEPQNLRDPPSGLPQRLEHQSVSGGVGAVDDGARAWSGNTYPGRPAPAACAISDVAGRVAQ